MGKDTVNYSSWWAKYNSGYWAWVTFYRDVLNIKGIPKEYQDYENFRYASFIYMFDGLCFCVENHTEIHHDGQRLHNPNGMAVKFSDGWGVYVLNGVVVPEYLVMTPESQLDIEFFKKEKNADVKAEFIRKFGIERMQGLGKKICDASQHSNEWFRRSEYELWDMGSVYQVNYAPHLKMKNLTTGIWHFEAVGPECQTIEDALKYRANGRTIKLEGVK